MQVAITCALVGSGVVSYVAHQWYKSKQCSYCKQMGHTMRGPNSEVCPVFKVDRDVTSKDIAVEPALLNDVDNKSCDLSTVLYTNSGGVLEQPVTNRFLYKDLRTQINRKGFSAAGYLPYSFDTDGTMYLYLLSETRNGKTAFNFPGGKRDAKDEDPVDTASREFTEETPYRVISHRRRNATHWIWIGRSKYYLIPLNIEDVTYRLEPKPWFGPRPCRYDLLVRKSLATLNSADLWHDFAWSMFQSVFSNTHKPKPTEGQLMDEFAQKVLFEPDFAPSS